MPHGSDDTETPLTQNAALGTGTDHDFPELMRRVCASSEEAAQELIDRYGHHILRVVRRRMHKRLRSRYDSVDFVQSVWASFFALPLDQFRFDDPQALTQFLSGLARNKVIEVVRRRLQTLKHDQAREQRLEAVGGQENEQLVAHLPTPSQVAIAREEWDRLLQGQPTRDQLILQALVAGQSTEEVAEELGLCIETVRRVVRKVAPRE